MNTLSYCRALPPAIVLLIVVPRLMHAQKYTATEIARHTDPCLSFTWGTFFRDSVHVLAGGHYQSRPSSCRGGIVSWNLETNAVRFVAQDSIGQYGWPQRAGFNADSSMVVMGGYTWGVGWNTEELIDQLYVRHQKDVGLQDVQYVPYGSTVVGQGLNDLSEYDPVTGDWIRTIYSSTDRLAYFYTWIPDEQLQIAVAVQSGVIRIIDYTTGELVRELVLPGQYFLPQTNPLGTRLLLQGTHYTAGDTIVGVHELDLATDRIVRSYSDGIPGAGIYEECYDHTGKRILTVTFGGSARVWSTETGGVLASFNLNFVTSRARFSPDGSRIVIVGDTVISVWELTPVSDVADHAANNYAAGSLQLQPNPTAGYVDVRYELARRANVQVMMHDVLGKEVIRLNDIMNESGVHTVRLDLKALSNGVYTVTLEAADEVIHRRLVVHQ